MWILEKSVDIGSHNNTATKNKSIKAGLAYHRRVYKNLREMRKGTFAEQRLYIEPWFRRIADRRLRQPDAVLVDPFTNTAVVVEVKLNWKDGRDEKLIKEYLEAARHALAVDLCWPVLVTSNVAGYRGRPLLGLERIMDCAAWTPGQITPVVLFP